MRRCRYRTSWSALGTEETDVNDQWHRWAASRRAYAALEAADSSSNSNNCSVMVAGGATLVPGMAGPEIVRASVRPVSVGSNDDGSWPAHGSTALVASWSVL